MIDFCDEIIVRIDPLKAKYDVTKLFSTFLYLFPFNIYLKILIYNTYIVHDLGALGVT